MNSSATNKRWLLGLGLLLVLSACPPNDHHGWALVNRRDHPLDVFVRKTELCTSEGDLSDESTYGPPERLRVRAQDFILTTELRDADSSYPSCGAAWVQMEDFDGVLVWDHEPYWSGDPIAYGVIVEGPRDHVVVHLPTGVRVLPAPE